MILTVTLNPAIDKVYQIDNYTIGGVFRPKTLTATAGGKGLNVSRVCRILGADVVATGFLGGSNGQFIRKEIEKIGIKDAFIEIDGETRICLAMNDPINKTSTEVLEPGPNISEEAQHNFLNIFTENIKQADIITISGSLPKGIQKHFYGELIQIAHSYNKRVILDTSGETLSGSISYKPYMIKPNREELEAVIKRKLYSYEDIISSAVETYNNGIPVVCITLGRYGCIAVCDEGIYNLCPPDVEIVNTVGSGDSFIAGFVTALEQGKSIKEALIQGTASGTSNTQFEQTGRVSKDMVDEYVNMISVKKMK